MCNVHYLLRINGLNFLIPESTERHPTMEQTNKQHRQQSPKRRQNVNLSMELLRYCLAILLGSDNIYGEVSILFKDIQIAL